MMWAPWEMYIFGLSNEGLKFIIFLQRTVVTFLMLINELLEMCTCIMNCLSLAGMSSLYQVDKLQTM
jgi:hypothetical protein